eukprot:s6520_g4.t2
MGYDTDGSSEFDLPGLESLAGRSQPFSTQAESVDLLGVEPTLVDLEQVSSVPAASAAPASAATPDQPASLVPADLPAVPLPPPAEAPVDVPSDEEDLPPWAWGPGMDLDPVFVPAPADPGADIGAGPADPPASGSAVPPAVPAGQPEARAPTVGPFPGLGGGWQCGPCGGRRGTPA